MHCQRCNSNRVLAIRTWSQDAHVAIFKGKQYLGHAPEGITPGWEKDKMDFDICLDCGQMQGEWPIEKTDEDIEKTLQAME